MGRLGQLGDDALLQEGQAVGTVRLAALQDDDGPAFPVVAGIKPVPQRKRGVGMRLIYRVIVEMVDWNLNGARWVEFLKVPGNKSTLSSS